MGGSMYELHVYENTWNARAAHFLNDGVYFFNRSNVKWPLGAKFPLNGTWTIQDHLEGTYLTTYAICKATTFEVQGWRGDDFQDTSPYGRHFFQYLKDPNPNTL